MKWSCIFFSFLVGFDFKLSVVIFDQVWCMKYSRHVFLIAKSVCVKQLIMCSKRYVYFNLIYWFCLHDDGMYWIFITMTDILVLMNTLWHDLNWHEVYVSVWNPCRDQGVIENIFFSWLSVQFLKTVTDKSLQILALWIRIGDQDIFFKCFIGLLMLQTCILF